MTVRQMAVMTVVLAILLGSVGCFSGDADVRHFVFSNGGEPETIDPGLVTGSPGITIINQIFEGLTSLDPQTLEPKPGAAERWDISDDALVYTFHLRPTAAWSDGQPLTAHDFDFAWRRVLDPATGARYADQLYVIAGAEARHRGDSDADLGITVLDDHRLEVRLHAPCAYFLELTAFATFMPVPRQAITAQPERWTFDQPPSNGPFMIERWSVGERMVMVPNPHYWDRDAVRLERITALPIDNHDTAYQRFIAGAIDWMNTVPAGKMDEAQRHPGFYTHPFLASYYFRVNVTRPPLDDVRVRQALSQAIDRGHITRHVTGLGEIPATWYCPQMGDYQPPPGLGYDPEAARAALAAAGFGPDGQAFPALTLLYNNSDMHQRIAEAIVQQWEENLGIVITLRNAEWGSYMGSLSNLDYDLARSGWIGDFHDPITFYHCFVSSGGNNRTGWSDDEYDALLREAGTSPDANHRLELFARLETILTRESLPIIPLFIYVNKGLISERVRHFSPNIRDLLFCKYLDIVE